MAMQRITVVLYSVPNSKLTNSYFTFTVKIEPFLQCAVLIPLTELIVEPKVAERPYFVENRNESFLSDHEMDLKKYDVSASSSSTPTDSISQRQKLFQRFLQLTAVRKFMKLIAYLMNLLWNRIIPSIRSSLAFFNFFSSTAMPVTASDKEKYQVPHYLTSNQVVGKC